MRCLVSYITLRYCKTNSLGQHLNLTDGKEEFGRGTLFNLRCAEYCVVLCINFVVLYIVCVECVALGIVCVDCAVLCIVCV